MGVDASSSGNLRLEAEEFDMILEEESELVEVASPILERVRSTLMAHECLLNLANAQGICLKTWTGKGESFRVRPGERVTEEFCGTAGMPLCFIHGKPVIVYGAEHYCQAHHGLVCVANPVFSQTGKLLGGISVSFQIEIFHPWSITFMQEAAINISEQLQLRNALNASEMLMEAFAEGVMLLGENGAILHANKNAREMLGIEDDFSGKIYDALEGECLKKLRLRQSVSNEEVKITNCLKSGAPKRCLLSYRFSEKGGMVNLRSTKQLYGYVAQTVGINACYHFSDIRGSSKSMQTAVQMAQKYATSDSAVLIIGESGTGKELFAHAIHNGSSRHNKPFVAVNCGALPRELVQSELFGYSPGAFTGARKQGNPGKFELAESGTIFLDEIGEMERDAQTSLLRFLQSGEVSRLGEGSARRVDVRVIAATNRDLYEAIREGRFREDLFHRLNIFMLRIPALRQRPEDIPELAHYMLARMAEQHPHLKRRTFSEEAMFELMRMPWPGNVRELEHSLERIIFLSKNHVIQVEDVRAVHYGPGESHETCQPAAAEKMFLEELLENCGGNVKEVAKICGVGKTTVYSRLKQYRIDARDFRKLKRAGTRQYG